MREGEKENVLKLRAVAGVSIIPRLWVSTLSQVLPVLLTATALALLPIEKMCDQVAESFSTEQNHFFQALLIFKNIF